MTDACAGDVAAASQPKADRSILLMARIANLWLILYLRVVHSGENPQQEYFEAWQRRHAATSRQRPSGSSKSGGPRPAGAGSPASTAPTTWRACAARSRWSTH